MIAERTKALLNAAAVIYSRRREEETSVVVAYALLARIEAREKATYPGRETVAEATRLRAALESLVRHLHEHGDPKYLGHKSLYPILSAARAALGGSNG